MGKKKASSGNDEGEEQKMTRIAIVSAEKCKPKKVRVEGQRTGGRHGFILALFCPYFGFRAIKGVLCVLFVSFVVDFY